MRIAIAIVLAAAAPARAGNNEVAIGSYTRALRAPSANALTDDSLVGTELGYARRIAVMPRMVLWATLGMTVGTADGSMFRTVTTHVESVAFAVGGRARYALHRNVALHARLDGGPANAAVTMTGTSGRGIRDTGWGASLTAVAGADLLAYAGERFGFGIRLELGYTTATAIGIDAKPDSTDDGQLALAMSRASLGGIDLGGRFFALSMLGQF